MGNILSPVANVRHRDRVVRPVGQRVELDPKAHQLQTAQAGVGVGPPQHCRRPPADRPKIGRNSPTSGREPTHPLRRDSSDSGSGGECPLAGGRGSCRAGDDSGSAGASPSSKRTVPTGPCMSERTRRGPAKQTVRPARLHPVTPDGPAPPRSNWRRTIGSGASRICCSGSGQSHRASEHAGNGSDRSRSAAP